MKKLYTVLEKAQLRPPSCDELWDSCMFTLLNKLKTTSLHFMGAHYGGRSVPHCPTARAAQGHPKLAHPKTRVALHGLVGRDFSLGVENNKDVF